MGVTGLWTVVAPTARPTKLETLNRKRLAVDASIWIYQFLKAVRDKEGNALRNSHVVGFFRRICKLLYFGIKPVFVFDGGAPTLKRETVRSRARRREGRREDAVRTAGKLLAVQVARAAEEEEKRRKETRERTPLEEELPPDQELVYVDEIGMNQKERQANRGFKRKDQYHLPQLDMSIEALGAPNDPRIMSQAELEEYAKQFHSGEDINLYDFSKIDFESPFFLSLPAGDRYNILNAARLRSRLRMGYSKEQLDGMFPDRMAFSKFQIERVKERNELTQRLMHINGMSEDAWDQGGRIVGEKGKEYVLVKNDGVEGGWALGVVSNKMGSKREDAIDLEMEAASDDLKQESSDDDFEDVAIEGLNRLPKSMRRDRRDLREVDYDITYEEAAARIARKRQSVYAARKQAAEVDLSKPQQAIKPKHAEVEGEGLFVPDEQDSDVGSDLFEDVNMSASVDVDEDEELQRAIAMSLEQPGIGSDDENVLHLAENEDAIDLRAALAESRKTKYQARTDVRQRTPPLQSKFDGPLPFESLNLGQSLLGKKKAQKVEENLSGGFDRESAKSGFKKKKEAQPMPSWFEIKPTNDDSRRWDETEVTEDARNDVDGMRLEQNTPPKRRMEVIDLEVDDGEDVPQPVFPSGNDKEDLYQPDDDEDMTVDDQPPILMDNEADDEENVQEKELAKEKAAKEREERYELARRIAAENDDQDDASRVLESTSQAKAAASALDDNVLGDRQTLNGSRQEGDDSEDNEDVDWSESEVEDDAVVERSPVVSEAGKKANTVHREVTQDDVGEDDEFEDVVMETNFNGPTMPTSGAPPEQMQTDYLVEAQNQGEDVHPEQNGFEDYFSDSDDELMRQLAIEAEEHARFASELNNNKSQAEARRDYENELKQLRSQQKRDRRDADEVTQVMIQECQALLRLFGLPYITAPMEAEAQCAELVHLGLVDGIVTDDSDIFLFGGTRIYKNMFNAAKFVECYLAGDLEKEYALDRHKLIRFAHLLGSDYTEGIPGIGPVTALEIISDFDTLEEFKTWCSKVQLGRPQDLENELTTPFRRKFKRTVQKKLFLPTSFPDLRVDQAYLKPEVDSDPEDFQWGVPDLDKLRGYLMATIGWSQERTDEILVPVVRDINKREHEGTQANITHFFTGGVGVGANNEGTAPRNRTGKESGRMKNAYTRLRGQAQKRQMESEDAEAEDAYIAEGVDETDETDGQEALKMNDDDESDDSMVRLNTKSKRLKKRKVKR